MLDLKQTPPRFTVRVELHGVQHDGHGPRGHRGAEYSILHEEMKAKGFAREVEAEGGRRVVLPPAEYDLEGHFTVSQVHALAKAATEAAVSRINQTPPLTFSLLVTKTDVRRMWENLAPMEP
jgi:hypothetical protein